VAEHVFSSAAEPLNYAVGGYGDDRVEGCVRDGAVARLALWQLMNQLVMSRRTVHQVSPHCNKKRLTTTIDMTDHEEPLRHDRQD
jgi:hypothetical protein